MIGNPYKTGFIDHFVNVDNRGDMEFLVHFARLNSPVNFCEIIVEELGKDDIAVHYPGDSSLNKKVFTRIKKLANQIIHSSRRQVLLFNML
jgi:hypothetical protein